MLYRCGITTLLSGGNVIIKFIPRILEKTSLRLTYFSIVFHNNINMGDKVAPEKPGSPLPAFPKLFNVEQLPGGGASWMSS
jgi:hypothetical protein